MFGDCAEGVFVYVVDVLLVGFVVHWVGGGCGLVVVVRGEQQVGVGVAGFGVGGASVGEVSEDGLLL